MRASPDIMNVTTEREAGVLSVRVEGRIDGSTVLAFHESIETALEHGDHSVIVDCEKLTYIGSAGLRTLLALAKAVSNRDARFALYAVSAHVMSIFEKSGFDIIITIRPSRAEAIAALAE